MNENDPMSFCLNALFQVGGLLGRIRRYGFVGIGVVLLEEVCHWR